MKRAVCPCNLGRAGGNLIPDPNCPTCKGSGALLMEEDDLHTVAGGGTRSEKAPAWHLVPLAGPRRTALRFGLGAEKHGPNNWLLSCSTEAQAKQWCDEAYNHMMEHIRKMIGGLDPSDDHLGAIGWAQTVLCYCEERYGKPWTHLSSVEKTESEQTKQWACCKRCGAELKAPDVPPMCNECIRRVSLGKGVER